MTNSKWFGELCNEVLIAWHAEEMAKCKENARCSRAHKQRMCEIIGHRFFITRAIRRRIVTALLAAAILLFAGCATYIYREKIADFFVEIYEKFSVVTDEPQVQNSDEDLIDEVYTLGYVPEGFVSTGAVERPQSVRQEWTNGDKMIVFTQRKNIKDYLDAERNNWEEIKINKTTLFYSQSNNWKSHAWADYSYIYCIKTNYDIDNEELENLILSVKK